MTPKQAATLVAQDEIEAMTGYKQPTRQLAILHERGFYRAWINASGAVVLEVPHYEAVSAGRAHNDRPAKSANLSFLRAA